jgi:uncharacterized protein (TIGR03790 family)
VTSATQFELLGNAPLALSATGVTTGSSDVTLDSLGGGTAWAIYALQGFPTDGSIAPVSVDITQLAQCWVAVSDFGSSRWEIISSDASGTITPTATELVSPTGTFYVAVLGFERWAKVTSLVVNTSADLAIPTPSLTTISATGELAAGIPSFFSAEGSDPGSGAGYDAVSPFTFDWNDGTDPVVTTDPLAEVSHTWDTPGVKTVTLTVLNDQGRSASRDFTVQVAQPFREMLVVYNNDIQESADLMDYYCSSRSGRLIDPAYVLGLPMGTNANADFNRSSYNAQVRDPIKSHLDSSAYKDSIKYILLLKGVPHRISDGAGSASVDSDLCLLYENFDPSLGSPYGWLFNDPDGLVVFGGQGFYGEDDADFVPNTYQVCYDPTWQFPNSGDEVPYTLNYLVGRLSAYTYDEAKLLVDRSVGADQSGEGWSILDSRPGTYGQDSDTMVDPVWPFTDPGLDCGYDLLLAGSFNVFQELTNERVTRGFATLPEGAADNVLAYCSWGVHSGHNNEYILNDLQFTYLPGACFMSYESFNGVNFNGDNLGGRSGQGQICDFFRMGGTCAIGNAWEPYTIGVGDERWVFNRYIIHGDRWIEAAYKGLRLLSWMEVVVGDPLCQVK